MTAGTTGRSTEPRFWIFSRAGEILAHRTTSARRPTPPVTQLYLMHLQQIQPFSTNRTAPNVLLPARNPPLHTPFMARYSAMLGRRIEVTYRAGDIILPATGNLAADSGKSIFLEESYKQKTGVKTFRWEIPYPCIVQLNECPEIPGPPLPCTNRENRPPNPRRTPPSWNSKRILPSSFPR